MMKCIVTHENADFDAVASLLAAARLYPEACALLPRRVNRNVRDFLTLYWDEFPLTRWEDAPAGKISNLILVDMQQIPPLKGLTPDTLFQVIDHHAPHPSRLPGAITEFLETGATATFLVEQLVKQGIAISPIEATLFLLGIYEDTGSLSYTGTTPRDARAAACLLDENARLDIVRDFLHYPLSADQLSLYKNLTDRLETREIAGQQVMIATALSEAYVEEISTLAHKIQDLYEPDALFLLIEMEDHVQMVCRSTTDAINVGFVAEGFGGGGHARAAAALTRNLSLADMHRQLVDTLRQVIKPVVTVRELMSRGVTSLAPNDTIAEAAEVVRRYGHEGYPVIDDERVVGIISRREIDKALHHRLGGAAVNQYMLKGEFFVRPDDSLDTLQALMTTHGIGQVPVIEGDKVSGIVTRTDIINLWSKTVPSFAETTNLASRLVDAVPAARLELIREAGELASGQGDLLYLVGGFVRDLLLGITNLDVDLVVEGDAIALAERLAKHHGGRVGSHKRFGTATWILPHRAFDIERLDLVSARQEFYEHPSALPEVERSSIKQDLHRRDFTINTLAIRLDPSHFGELLDFYGGRSDLGHRLIRVLHSLSFVEDPTRILRAIRLEQRLNFKLERHTADLVRDAIDLLDKVSGERLVNELERCLQEEMPEKVMLRLGELDVLKAILPDLEAGQWLADRYGALRHDLGDTPWAQTKPTELHYLGLLTFPLTPPAVTALANRLHLRASVETVLQQVQTLKDLEPTLSQPLKPSQLYELLAPFRDEVLLIALLSFQNEVARAQLIRFRRELKMVEPIIDGTLLRQLVDVRPGPIYGQLLKRLKAARLDGEVVTLEDEKTLIQMLLAELRP
jgi:tRNA nucleotidyltransferase (CCA-adding enzyme)